MVTLLRLHSLFETVSTVARLQTKSRTQDSQGRVRAAALFIYFNCYYLFGCLFVFCNWLFCCFFLCHFDSHSQLSFVLTLCQRACLRKQACPPFNSEICRHGKATSEANNLSTTRQKRFLLFVCFFWYFTFCLIDKTDIFSNVSEV